MAPADAPSPSTREVPVAEWVGPAEQAAYDAAQARRAASAPAREVPVAEWVGPAEQAAYDAAQRSGAGAYDPITAIARDEQRRVQADVAAHDREADLRWAEAVFAGESWAARQAQASALDATRPGGGYGEAVRRAHALALERGLTREPLDPTPAPGIRAAPEIPGRAPLRALEPAADALEAEMAEIRARRAPSPTHGHEIGI